MLNKSQFKEYFSQSIYPKLKKENFKLIFYQTSIIFFTLLAIALLIWGAIVFISGQAITSSYYFVPIIATTSIIMALVTSACYSNLKISIEQKILKPILLKVFEDVKFSYNKDKFIDMKYVNKSQIVPYEMFELSGEDFLQVSVPCNDEEGREILIKISDILVDVRRNTCDSNDKLETVDEGVFGVVDYGKEFKIQILGNFVLPDFDEVKTESLAFNKDFKCYSKNPFDACKTLTSQLMSKLLKLQGETNKKIRFHIKGSCLYFIVHKNLFKYKLKGKVDFSEAEQIYDQLYIICELAKELTSNKNIFK